MTMLFSYERARDFTAKAGYFGDSEEAGGAGFAA
jgi:hypothetical protein